MKIVLDTNVFVSALLKEGKPRQLLLKIIKSRKHHQLITSKEILEELVAVLDEPKTRKYVDQQDVARFLWNIATVSSFVEITSSFKVIENDPDDNIILRTAYDSRASYIISGDAHLLQLKRFKRTRIIPIEEMLRLL